MTLRAFISLLLRTALCVGVVLFALRTAGATGADTPCANPRSAADSLFVHQRPSQFAPQLAAQCMDLPADVQGARVAVQLKQILDARGYWVPVDDLPDDPDYLDGQGRARVVPMPEVFPQMALERGTDGQWRYSRSTIEQVPGLYGQTFSPISRWFQQQLPSAFYQRLLGLYLWQYAYAALLLLVAWAVGRIANILLANQLRRNVNRLGLKLDPVAVMGVRAPLSVGIAAAVVLWGISDLQLGIGMSTALYRIITVVLCLSVVVFASRLVQLGGELAKDWAAGTDSRLDDQLIPLVRQSALVAVWTLGLLFVLQTNGVDVWSLVAGLGIGGLAMALAAQDTLANIFGSITVFVDRPFQVGDWVKVGAVEGTVEEVGFRSTRIRTFYNSVVTIPNSTFNSINVDNMGVRHRRRVKMTLGLTYDTPPDTVQAFVEGVRGILAAHPYVERTYEVHFYNLGDSALEILVYYHLVVPGWTEELESRAENLMEFMRLADTLGVSFAFPSTSVYVESTPEHPMSAAEAQALEALESTAARFAPGGDMARPGGVPFRKSWSVKARTERGSAG